MARTERTQALGVAALLVCALQLSGQERPDLPLETATEAPKSADAPRCDVVLYTLEDVEGMPDGPGLALPDDEAEERDRTPPTRKGERVLAIPVQEEPIPLWAELSPLPEGSALTARRVRPPRVEPEPRSGIQVIQVMRVEELDADRSGLARERDEKRIPAADVSTGGGHDDAEAAASAVIVRLDTSAAAEGRWWLVIGDEAFWCAGAVQVVRTDAPLEDVESIEPAAGGVPPRAIPGARPGL